MGNLRTALVLGCSGQAGYFLTKKLLAAGYLVVGTVREPSAAFTFEDLFVSFPGRLFITQAKLDRAGEAFKIVSSLKPDETYNVASQMFAPLSWASPSNTMQVNGMVAVECLEALEKSRPDARFFQAGSAEVFEPSQLRHDESSLLRPRNPYGIAKAVAQEAVRVYRDRGLFACTGIFFNMESSRRSRFFFARKVVSGLALIKALEERGEDYSHHLLRFGDLKAMRDWGLCREYVGAAWRMMLADVPSDYVIATGKTYSCGTFLDTAHLLCGLSGPVDRYVTIDKTAWRPGGEVETDCMFADPGKIKKELGWQATTKGILNVVGELVKEELALTRRALGAGCAPR